jgi:hypothetical protein
MATEKEKLTDVIRYYTERMSEVQIKLSVAMGFDTSDERRQCMVDDLAYCVGKVRRASNALALLNEAMVGDLPPAQ